MKVLIWISTLFIITLLNVILGEATGFRAGTLVIYFFWFWLAKKLCSLWDKNRIGKKAEKEGLSSFEYIKKEIPTDVLTHSESNRCNEEELKSYYKACVKEGKINKVHSYILIDEFMSPRRTTVAEVNNIPNEDKVVFCRKCGTKLLERSQFCSKCGTEVVINEER